jgi:hypothetical protein
MNPMQPIIKDPEGTIRFQQNDIVADLLDFASARGLDMNEIVKRACFKTYSQNDLCQFYQLIGYSLSGYHELNHVSDKHAKAATKAAKKVVPTASGCRDHNCSIHKGVPLEGIDGLEGLDDV